jgi:chromosome segregation ATPase
MNTHEDVLERLWAAFETYRRPVRAEVGPQLLADAHAEILALRRELADAQARADDHYERLAVRTWERDAVEVEAAATLRAHRAEVDRLTVRLENETRNARNARRAAGRYQYDALEYHAAVAPLAEEIRRARAGTSSSVLAPTLVDTRLALKCMKTIARANELYARRRTRAEARTRQHPEGLTA